MPLNKKCKIIRIIRGGAISMMCLTMIKGQDPEFTQFYANVLYLNPAFAGTYRCPRFILGYRNQWPMISGTFVQYFLSYDQFVERLYGGIGAYVLADDAGEGTIKFINASFMYSYALHVNRYFTIHAALQVSYVQKWLDWTKLVFPDMIDPRYGFVYPTKDYYSTLSYGYPDFAAGILGYTNMFFGGIAVHHLFEPKEGFVTGEGKLPRKYTAHVGAYIPIKKDPKEGAISPNILFQQQQDFTQLNIGLYFAKEPFVVGAWYRNQDAFIVVVGVHKGILKFGYSYDLTVSKLSISTGGSHEVSVGFYLHCRPKKRRFRPLQCPSF